MGEECISVKITSFGIVSAKAERELCKKAYATSDLAVLAAEKCLADISGDERELIGGILLSTGLPDNFGTSTSTLVKNRLGLKQCACHDLTVGDAGFIYALQLGVVYIKCGKYKSILVVAAETPSTIFKNGNKKNREIEDTAGAVLIKKTNKDAGFSFFSLYNNYCKREITGYPVGGSRYPISFNAVMRDECKIEMNFIVKREDTIASLVTAIRNMKAKLTISSDTKVIFPINFDAELIAQIMEKSDIPIESAVIADKMGYSGSAGIAFALGEFLNNNEQQKIKYLLLIAGSSFSYGMALYKIRE